jgi:hypothetical protein
VNIFTEGTFLKARVIHSAFLSPEEKITTSSVFVWWNPLTWWQPEKVEKSILHVIRMSYDDEYNARREYTSSHSDYAVMKENFDKIIEQIKAQDHQITDRELEEAIMKNGSKT